MSPSDRAGAGLRQNFTVSLGENADPVELIRTVVGRSAGQSSDDELELELRALIRESPHVFDFLQGAAMDGIWYWRLDSRVHAWMSARFWEVLGYSDDDRPTDPDWWTHNVDRDDLSVWLSRFDAHRRGDTKCVEGVIRYPHKDGYTVWLDCRGVLFGDGEEGPVRMLGTHHDVSALKEAEFILTERANELQRLNGELEQFATLVSHDLQAPLRMVSRCCALLKEDLAATLTEEQGEYLEYAVTGAQKMSAMIDELMDFSRVVARRENFDRLSVGECIDDAILLCRTEVEGGAKIQWAGSSEIVHGDRSQLGRVFMNLITNALRHARPGIPLVIGIEVQVDGASVVVSVHDNGTGIPDYVCDRMFDIFYSGGTGTGLGLAICRRIMSHHRGRIWHEKNPDGGATFRVAIPRSSCAF